MYMKFPKGELILRQGDPANRFYLILNGKVSLESHRTKRGVMRVQTVGPGEVLGWSWLFHPHFWRFDARATEPTEAIFLYGTLLRDECESDPDFGYELIRRMTEVVLNRLQSTRKQLLGLGPKFV